MRHPFLTPTVAMIVGLSAGFLQSQVPPTQAVVVAPTPQLAYQGRLLEAGVAANGARLFVFSLKDVTGLELWNSGTQTVPISEGMYSVVLGATGMTALPATVLNQSGLKLHVVIGGVAMSPDVDLIPAFQARSAWELVGTFSGDVMGSQTQTVLTQIQGIPVDLTTTRPTAGQGLIYNGTKFVPSTVLGPKGDPGLTGATGAIGATGAVGATGATGSVGLQGPAGLPGATGLMGATGATGASGLDGRTVLNGVIDPAVGLGVNGDFYLNTTTNTLFGPKASGAWSAGVSLVGPQGSTGAAGATGPQGATGASGTNGNDGAAGAPGAAGAKGDTGAQGPTGPAGATGATGATGVTGATGAPGATGPQGPLGVPGATGLTGATGATGASGLDGRSVLNGVIDPAEGVGVHGDFYLNTVTSTLWGPNVSGVWPASGVSLLGPRGATGAAGVTGPQGATGATGSTGAQGPAGPTGSTGATGAPGTNGATGATGASPFTLSGTSAVYMAGKVGIGSASPVAMLDVGGEARIHGLSLGYGLAKNYTNTVFGMSALATIDTGAYNVALGWEALKANVVGQWNLSLGALSLTAALGDGNTGVGYGTGQQLTTGSKNTLLGWQAGNLLTTESYNIAIGNQGTPGDSGTIRIGASGWQTSAYIAGIRGVTPSAGATAHQMVIVKENGQLGSQAIPDGDGGTVTSVGVGGLPLSVTNASTTPIISLAQATSSVSGYLSSTDWGTFNSKQAALASGTSLKTVGGNTLLGSGDAGVIGVSYGGTGTATAPSQGGVVYAGSTTAYASTTAGVSGQVLTSNGTNAPTWSSVAPLLATVNAQTASYTLLLTDANAFITMNNASAMTLTLPNGFPTGFQCTVAQLGLGQITLSAPGTLVTSALNKKTNVQGSGITVIVVAANTWMAFGDMN